MAFIAVRDGVRRLYLRQLESGEATAVSGSEGAEYPLFSPDGQWVAFNANGSLLKVSATGGMPIVLCKAPDVRGLSWGDDGTIVFAPTYGVGGLARVADGGGQPHTRGARENDTAAEGYRWPQLLSPEKLMLFTAWTRNIDESEIIAKRLDTNERKVVLRGGTHARYLPSGQLLYLRAGTLMAVRFDPARMEAIGSPVPVMQGVSMTAEGGGQYDPTNQTPQAVSPDGQLLVFGNQPLDLRTVPLTAGGKPRPFIESPFRELGAAISPDSTAIAYASDESGRYEIYVQPFPNGGAKTQVSTDGGQTPRWSASGEIFYLAGPRVVAVRVTTKPTLTVSAPQVLFTSTSYVETNNPFDVTADGQRLLMIKEDDRSAASTRIDLVQNWGRELNRLAPR